MIEVYRRIKDIRERIKKLKQEEKTIGFVPTMGYLHEGHLSLVRKSVKENDVTVVSIFVNPTQFGPGEDFSSYPRDFERDKELLEKENASIIFNPSAEEMYEGDYKTYVVIEELDEFLCGRRRKNHFKGVMTVVLKLFNIVQPDVSYFGQKDAQQAIIITKMVKDLNIPTKIKVLPIVREKDGLAMSSRNKYLNEDERKNALCLYHAVKEAEKMFEKGERDTKTIKDKMFEVIHSYDGVKIDYIEIVDLKTLKSISKIKDKALCALAVYIGKARLIDNTILGGSFEDLGS